MSTQVDDFVYLGGKISDNGSSEPDVRRRIGLACDAAKKLQMIWKAKGISMATKVRVYECLVLSILLYNAEVWTLTADLQRRLRVFEMGCLRRIAGVTRWDCLRNVDIKARLGITNDIVQKIQTRRLRYFGHVCRMESSSRLTYVAMHGSVQGQRGRGRPRKRWLDNVKADCTEKGLNIVEAERATEDRQKWRTILKLSQRA